MLPNLGSRPGDACPQALHVCYQRAGLLCDPRGPWQRGSNENTNGLLRQYFPRGTDFSRISQSYLDSIALRSINFRERPWALKPRPINYERCCTDRLDSRLHYVRARLHQRREQHASWTVMRVTA